MVVTLSGYLLSGGGSLYKLVREIICRSTSPDPNAAVHAYLASRAHGIQVAETARIFADAPAVAGVDCS
jgi:hypothetical protein